MTGHRRRHRRWRSHLALLAAIASVVLPTGTAFADAAGPTDYRTDIVAIEPATNVVTVSIVGGDAFMRMRVEPGHEVIVLGYQNEPYLRFGADGVISENVLSYATYYNESRYGSEAPDTVDNTAPPQWRRVGGGGVWAWHDHRAHWMEQQPPIGLEPGDALPDATVPMLIDGVATEVVVRTTLLSSASWVPAAIGVLLGLGVGLLLAAGATRRRWRAATVAMAVMSVLCLVVGLGEFVSLPAETGPQFTWWALPLIALFAALSVWVVQRRATPTWRQLGRSALLALAALNLVVWAWPRRAGWTAALVPTALPAWIDRSVSAGALAFGLIATIATVVALVATRPDPSTAPPRPRRRRA